MYIELKRKERQLLITIFFRNMGRSASTSQEVELLHSATLIIVIGVLSLFSCDSYQVASLLVSPYLYRRSKHL